MLTTGTHTHKVGKSSTQTDLRKEPRPQGLAGKGKGVTASIFSFQCLRPSWLCQLSATLIAPSPFPLHWDAGKPREAAFLWSANGGKKEDREN